MGDSDWNFNNFYLWRNSYPGCGGKFQSPINIDTSPEVMEECNIMCQLDMRYKKSQCRVNYNEQNMITLEYEPGSYAKFNETPFQLTKIFIHTPSMHTIDGERYDAEIIMLHSTDSSSSKSDNKNSLTGLMVCKLLNRRGNEFGNEQEFFNEFFFRIPKKPLDYYVDVPVSNDWSAEKILPVKNTSFFMYDGSLPFPPCDENYKVIVFEEIGNIGNTNFDLLKENIGSNNRPTQPLNNRKLFYNPGRKLERQKTRRLLASSDKFLKCVETDLPKKNREIVKKPKEVFIDEKMAYSSAKMIKITFMCIVFSFLMLLAYMFVVFLYRGYNAQKFLMVLLPENVKDDQRLDSWKECSGTIGQKVFGDIEAKKIIRINNQKIRTVESQIARGKFKNPIEKNKAIEQINTMKEGIKNARLRIEGKDPKGNPLYNEKGERISFESGQKMADLSKIMGPMGAMGMR